MSSRGATFIAPLPGTPPVGMSATDGRLALGGIFGTTPQLVAGGGISQSGSNMQFTLAQSVFQLADVTNAAATAFLPTDSIVLTPAAGPGTGSRIDLICIPLKNYENGDASSQSTPILVAGTAGTPGVAPAVPAGSYKYAQILVPTSAATASACTVTLAGNTTFAPVSLNTPSAAALALGTGASNQKAYSATEQVMYRWNGSAWVATASNNLYCKLALTAAQNASNGGYVTKITWDTELADPLNMHAPNASRVTVPVAGRYRVTFRGVSAAANATFFGIIVSKNGTTLPETEATQTPTVNSSGNCITTATLILAVNDYLEAAVYTVGALALTVAGCFFTVEFVGEA